VKRFYATVRVRPGDDEFSIFLDERPMRTPAKHPFSLPTVALADAIAEEWEVQPAKIDPSTMPLTRHAYTAIDGVRTHASQVADEIARFGETDLLCYRANAPEALARQQAEAWQPLLDWLYETYGVGLVSTSGVVPTTQDPDGIGVLRRLVGGYNAFELAALHTVVSISGSLVIGFAVATGRLDAENAWRLSRVDHDFQADRWGVDHEAAALAAKTEGDLAAAVRFLALARSSQS
jgi:chaperone required for assembly of F1-ATPase